MQSDRGTAWIGTGLGFDLFEGDQRKNLLVAEQLLLVLGRCEMCRKRLHVTGPNLPAGGEGPCLLSHGSCAVVQGAWRASYGPTVRNATRHTPGAESNGRARGRLGVAGPRAACDIFPERGRHERPGFCLADRVKTAFDGHEGDARIGKSALNGVRKWQTYLRWNWNWQTPSSMH